MAQWWNMRHLLITGQGNFGSIHGLPPAAMRYTEAKLSPVAAEMLEDIKLDTVDFQPNYDEKYQEPRVLPGQVPQPAGQRLGGDRRRDGDEHPAAQPGRGLRRRRSPTSTTRRSTSTSCWRSSPAPTSPPAARSAAAGAFARRIAPGGARSIVRAKYEIEEQKDGRSQIVFTEIPYQLTKEPLLKKLAELVNGGRVTGVSDIDD